MKYFKLLKGDYPSFTLGKIYPEDSHGDTGKAMLECIRYATVRYTTGSGRSNWEEVSLQDYAEQELENNKLVQGAYYEVLGSKVIFKYDKYLDAYFYLNAYEKVFKRNGGNFTYKKTKAFKIAEQEDIEWLDTCDRRNKFVPKMKKLNIDLENFAIVVRNSNAREIVVYLESINVFPKGLYNGNSMDGTYYLKDNGKINCTGNNGSFKVPIYTLEEFKEAYKNLEKEQILAEVSAPLFTLPTKWCVKPKNTDEANKIFEFEPIGKHGDSRYIKYYQHFPPFKSQCTADHKINEGYTEITFEQFEKYVLNKQENKEVEGISIEKLKRDQEYVVYIGSEKEWQQLNTLCGFKVTTHYCGAYCYSPAGRSYSTTSNKTSPGSYHNNITKLPSKVITVQQIKETMPDKKLIGYKLSGVVDNKTAARTLECLDTIDSRGLFFTEKNLLGSAVRRAKELGILDIWFTPVYEERELKVGDHIVFLKGFDGAPKGHIAVVNEIQRDPYQGAKGWVKYSPEVGNGGGFRLESNGYYLNKDFRFATPEEIKEFNEIKAGDWVVVLPEDGNYENSEKQAQKVNKINKSSCLKYSLHFQDGSTNSYDKVRKATQEEIKAVHSKPNVSIKGYQSKVSKDSVAFGCQTYSKDFVLQLGKFLKDSSLKIEHQEEIEKVVKYFERK